MSGVTDHEKAMRPRVAEVLQTTTEGSEERSTQLATLLHEWLDGYTEDDIEVGLSEWNQMVARLVDEGLVNRRH